MCLISSLSEQQIKELIFEILSILMEDREIIIVDYGMVMEALADYRRIDGETEKSAERWRWSQG